MPKYPLTRSKGSEENWEHCTDVFCGWMGLLGSGSVLWYLHRNRIWSRVFSYNRNGIRGTDFWTGKRNSHIYIWLQKLKIHLLLERVLLNFPGHSLAVTHMQGDATKRLQKFRKRFHFLIDARWIYGKTTHYLHWFPNRRGLIVGLVLGGFGAGALLFTPVQTGFINPANLKVNTTTGLLRTTRQPKTGFALLGAHQKLYATGDFKPCSTGVPAASGNNSNSANNRISAHAGKTASEPFFSGNCNLDGLQKKSGMVDVPPLTVFKALDFYLLWLSVCCGAIPITLVTSLYKVAGSRYIYDDIFLAGVSMAASVCNSVGRVIWGRICDRISFKVPMCCMCISWTALLLSFPFISVFTGTAAKATFVLWVGFMFLCQCGIFVFAPTAAATIFGAVNFAVNYGFVYTAFLVGSLIASMMTNLGPAGASIEGHFFVAGAMSLLCEWIV
ncbi:hypothetical protein T265_00234 [Opisthorchis viverrini]|uniref:Major facilitator superfamily (MFS) profile domain-containing protein n=1 Tax=Opisthorchis viverrini TaxID=6198 RepID=A0A075AJV7_OPIVI|nr:hypothetical protein T265_00234 [Opisthorchis viverrini]KER34054.1 hypothetical protein T265_00234 [Opisthorchis viverrini]